MWISAGRWSVLATLAILLLASCESGVEPESEQPAPPPAAPAPMPTSLNDVFPEGLGRSLVLDSCGSCHAAACSAIGQRTTGRWKALEADHRDRVADMSDADYRILFVYLAENFNDTRPEPMVPPQFLAGGCTPF